MIHNRVRDDNSGDHWGVSITTGGCGLPASVLAQLQSECEQVRLRLTPEQAEDFAQALLANAQRARREEAAKRAEGLFVPSAALCDLVLDSAPNLLQGKDLDQARRLAASQLADAVLGLLGSLAGELRHSKLEAKRPLATQAGGIDSVLHEPLFARVPVRQDERARFLSMLSEELADAAGDDRVHGHYWGLHKNNLGELSLLLWPEPAR